MARIPPAEKTRTPGGASSTRTKLMTTAMTAPVDGKRPRAPAFFAAVLSIRHQLAGSEGGEGTSGRGVWRDRRRGRPVSGLRPRAHHAPAEAKYVARRAERPPLGFSAVGRRGDRKSAV